MNPFLRWAGGKRRQAERIAGLLPQYIHGRYYEPFIGGGAVFFHLVQAGALRGPVTLSDVNEDLVNLWCYVRDQPDKLARLVTSWPNTEDHYANIRSGYGKAGSVEAAARILWLNAHCFNGLTRYNKSGQFNVPRDPKRQNAVDVGNLYSVSNALQRLDVHITTWDAMKAIHSAQAGDVVYADPPYWPVKATSFTAYTRHQFGEEEHNRLSLTLSMAKNRGVKWVLSSSDAPGAVKLYEHHGFRIRTVKERRNINSNGAGRGAVRELLVTPCRRSAGCPQNTRATSAAVF